MRMTHERGLLLQYETERTPHKDRLALRDDTTRRQGGTIQDETHDETKERDAEDETRRHDAERDEGAGRYAPFLPAHFVVPWQRISMRGAAGGLGLLHRGKI